MGYLTREQILKAQDLETEAVEVPEWGGKVLVRSLTGTERDAFEGSIVDMPAGKQPGSSPKMKMDNIRAKLVARSVVDEAGELIFTDKDIQALGQKSAAALDRVFAVAQRLSGITDEDVEALAENFGGGQSGGSTSD